MDLKILTTVFTSVFIAELGDKTQLATMLFAADKDSSKLTVFIGAALALVLTSAIGVAAGSIVSQYVSEKTLQYVAGVGFIGSTVEEMSPERFRQTLETNLFGVFYACHYAIPMMKQRGGGYIINISSLAGQNPHPRMAAYNASKFGLNGFSEALMQEVRGDNIKVSYICPGSVNTEFGGDEVSDEKSWQLQPEDIAQTVLNLLSMNERALPSKIEIRPSKPPKK